MPPEHRTVVERKAQQKHALSACFIRETKRTYAQFSDDASRSRKLSPRPQTGQILMNSPAKMAQIIQQIDKTWAAGASKELKRN